MDIPRKATIIWLFKIDLQPNFSEKEKLQIEDCGILLVKEREL